jgi:Tfp pilus assembly protein FimT
MVFTLIVGVLASMAAMNMTGQLSQHRLSGATRYMTWDFMNARMKAIKLRKNVQIAFVDTQTYTIWIDINQNGTPDSGETKSKNLHDQYPGVHLTSTDAIHFNSRGAPSNPVTITLSNSTTNKIIKINVSGFINSI